MQEQSITNQWTCECSKVNSLRKKCCINCGREVSKSVLDKIYKEEINAVNKTLKREGEVRRWQKRGRKVLRCRKVGDILNKLQVMTIVLFAVALVACNGARCYFFPDTINSYSENYLQNRGARLQDENGQFQKKFIGMKKVLVVINDVWERTWDSIGDIKQGLLDNRETINKNIKEKVNHIIK